MSLSVFLKPQQAIDKDHSLPYELFWVGITSISGENVWNGGIRTSLLELLVEVQAHQVPHAVLTVQLS